MQKKLSFVFAGVLLFGCLFIGTLYHFVVVRGQEVGLYIADDIERLATIFSKIDSTCGIISFDYQKNPINFLNVAHFVSSEVGSMNLKYPDKWQGPYLNDNPTMQGIEYQVVRTQKGYFITPGERIERHNGILKSKGVTLPNGKEIGKDIILEDTSDIAAMIKDPDALSYKGRPLAAAIKASNS